MLDFNLLNFVTLIPIVSLGILNDNRTLKITVDSSSTEATKVRKVLINGIASPNFIVESPTVLYADMPVLNTAVETVTLVGDGGTTSMVTFTAKSTQELTDKRYSLQRFFRFLFMDTGTDIFNSETGGGLVSLAGQLDFYDAEVVISNLIREVSKQVIDSQVSNLSPSKTIVRVDPTSIINYVGRGVIHIELNFSFMDGNTIDTGFAVAGYN